MIGSVVIRPASLSDAGFLAVHDRHAAVCVLEQSIASGRVIVAEKGGVFAGWLRWGLFWDSIPFINMLFLLPGFRRCGLGRMLVTEWESSMRGDGFSRIMTSTQADEEAQHFYRKLGFSDCGCLFLKEQAASEIFMCKDI